MKLHHVRDNDFTVYIGRPSVLGNPFIIGTHGTRKQVIKQFEKYARKNERVLAAIAKLKRNAILGCHCAPKACHGSVIIAIKKELTQAAKAKTHAAPAATDVPSVSRKSGTRKAVRRVSGRSRGRDQAKKRDNVRDASRRRS